MRVQYISSATVVVEHAGKRVLCDPWLTDGIYYGSWFHYPPLTYTPEDFADVDGIYISHIHPDHLDPATLERLPRHIPIFIHDYAEKFVHRVLTKIGFQEIREAPHRGVLEIAPDFTLEILAADNCDPGVCGKFFGCAPTQSPNRSSQIDTLAVFHGGGKTVVNVNDCPQVMAGAACQQIVERYGAVDFLMVGYAGAGPYPQCFDNLDAEAKRERGEAKRKQFLHQAAMYLKHLRPASFLPFAGQYTLGGRLSALNPFRGVPELEELPDLFAPLLAEHDLSAQMVLLNSGEWFNVSSQFASAPFSAPDPLRRAEYVRDVLAHKRYPYEIRKDEIRENKIRGHEIQKEEAQGDEVRQEIREGTRKEASGEAQDAPPRGLPSEEPNVMPRLQQAQARMLRYQDTQGGYRSDWKLYLDTGQERLYCVPFDGCPVTESLRGLEEEPFVRITLDHALLEMILDRKAHWNNLEIGSHLRFCRQPDVFERAVYHFLCYFHA